MFLLGPLIERLMSLSKKMQQMSLGKSIQPRIYHNQCNSSGQRTSSESNSSFSILTNFFKVALPHGAELA
jgi:hypothetical protein